MFLLFFHSAFPDESQLNSFSSSLQSLSKSTLFRRKLPNILFSSTVKLFLYNFYSVQHSNLRVYLNLRDILFARRTTTIYILSLNLYAEARHGPAVTVIPVFIPKNPYLLKSLFVLCHITVLFGPLYVGTEHEYYFVPTIFWKRGSFKQIEHSLATSTPVE